MISIIFSSVHCILAAVDIVMYMCACVCDCLVSHSASTCLHIYLCILVHSFVRLFIYLFILFIYLFTFVSAHLSIYRSIFLPSTLDMISCIDIYIITSILYTLLSFSTNLIFLKSSIFKKKLHFFLIFLGFCQRRFCDFFNSSDNTSCLDHSFSHIHH